MPKRPSHLGNTGWKINSNLLNHFFPTLAEWASVLSVFHFHERPIDDCPAHNVVLWHREDPEAIRTGVELLTQGPAPFSFVWESQPFMDDRYCLPERR